MAIEAYIFVECTSGRTKEALQKIRVIAGVKTAHAITGKYDIIIFAEAEDLINLGDIVVSKIQAVDGVLKTTTSMVVNF